MMDRPVSIKETTVVKPSDHTPSCVLNLSAIDSQLFLRFTIEYLLLYHPVTTINRISVADRVKKALGRVLVHYYPLAGRVIRAQNSHNLKVECQAQGALFIEAEDSRCTVAELKSTPTSVTQWRKLLIAAVDDVLEGSPPVVVQLTWLSGGGAALAVGLNHCLTDGVGSSRFLNSFARLASNEPESVGIEHDLTWDRYLLDPKAVSEGTNDPAKHPEFGRVDDFGNFASRFSEPLIPTSFCFTKQRLDSMKESYAAANSFTCFEVLAGLVWRAWASALELPSNQIVKLLFSVDIRTRVKPNLPSGYYGNGFVLGCAHATVKELTGNGLVHAAVLVRKAKERIGDEYVREVIDLVSRSSARPDLTGVLILSEWSKLRLERVDFGMGQPIQVGSVCVDRYCLFLPVPGNPEAVRVMVALPATAVAKYRRFMRTEITKNV